MTIEALSPKAGRTTKATSSDALAIGETDSNIFNCPACARPLETGSARCPGCGTRLIAGVRASRAIPFIAGGLAIGLFLGAGAMAAVSGLSRVEPVTAGGGTGTLATAAPVTSAAPITSAAPVTSAGPVAPVVPIAALSALRQTALVNQRIATDAGVLAAALAETKPSTAQIARALRSMSSNATFAERIAPDVADWEPGALVAVDLSAFYSMIRSTASDGLGAALGNEAAYIAAAQHMLAVVQGLGTLDESARSLAAQADVELPEVIFASPASTAAPATP